MTSRPTAPDVDSVWKALCDALRQSVTEAGFHPSSARPLLVAFSGGVDSTAMLHCATTLWPGFVRAVHVHHGLQAAANFFETHCTEVCAKWDIPLSVERLQLRPERGDSIEEAAREGRYSALANAAKTFSAGPVLLAQHANDQLETLLLALSRGAGVRGLASMPSKREWHGQLFLRPWLALPGRLMRELVEAWNLPFVEDPSNSDLRFTRNNIRQKLVPQLLNVFPAFLETSARSARHCAQAAAILDEQARMDLEGRQPPSLEWLRSLQSDRLANVLRRWLQMAAGRTPSTKQLTQLMQQIQRATTRGHRLDVPVAGGRVQRHGDRLHYVQSQVSDVKK